MFKKFVFMADRGMLCPCLPPTPHPRLWAVCLLMMLSLSLSAQEDIGVVIDDIHGRITGSHSPNAQPLVTLAPNPTTGVVAIRLKGEGEIREIEVLSNFGQQLMLIRIHAAEGKILLRNLNKGSYTLRIHTTSGTIFRRIVKI